LQTIEEGDNSPPQAPLFLIAVVLALLGFGIGMSQSALVEAVAKAVQRNRRQQLPSTLQTSLQQQEGDDGTDMDGKNYSIQQQWANGDDLERHICKVHKFYNVERTRKIGMSLLAENRRKNSLEYSN
jgi:hypothetical protein